MGLTLEDRTYLGEYYYGDEPFLADAYQGPMSTGPKLELTENFPEVLAADLVSQKN